MTLELDRNLKRWKVTLRSVTGKLDYKYVMAYDFIHAQVEAGRVMRNRNDKSVYVWMVCGIHLMEAGR